MDYDRAGVAETYRRARALPPATAHRMVEQRVSDGPREYAARVRARAFSSLQQISDEAFARGLARFDAWTASRPDDQPVYEPVDVFVFHR